jgi:formylglycine-generating enzyme required for sulfatase activity
MTVKKSHSLPLPAGYRVHLPTEAQWEKTARGIDARRWPWGNNWQEGLANTNEADLNQTSPVGLFPGGASPYEVLDMAGNVWEWTTSRWGKTSVYKPDYAYPYRIDDGREGLNGSDLRVVRGGSWLNGQRGARCACRFWTPPDDFFNLLGFRVVVSLANSEC